MNVFSGEQFVTDQQGHKKGVLLSWERYRSLLHTIEDLKDSLDLKRAKKTAKKFLSHDGLVQRLRMKR